MEQIQEQIDRFSSENGVGWKDLTQMTRNPEATEEEEKPMIFSSPIDYIEKTGLNNSEQIESLIQNGTYQDFKVHLVRLNALFRNLPPEEHNIDGETVRIDHGLLPISSEYKEQIVESAFDALKNISEAKNRGILMYNILGAVHLFGDANGRSIRVWHHLLSGKRLDNEELLKLTEHDKDGYDGTATTGRREITSHLNPCFYGTGGIINRLAFKPELDEIGAQNIRSTFPWIQPEFDEETIKALPVKDTNRVKDIANNDTRPSNCPFNILTMHMLAKEDPTFQTPPAKLKGILFLYDNEEDDKITFTAEQAKRFIAINDELKLRHFQTMIDIFQKPDEYPKIDGKKTIEWFYSQK